MNPLQSIVIAIFGWPGAIASLLLMGAGIAADRARAVAIGALVGTPFLFYFAVTPRFRYLAPAILALNYAAAFALARKQRILAAILCSPFVLFLMFVARIVLAQ